MPEPPEVLAWGALASPQETPSHPLPSWARAPVPLIVCFVLKNVVMASASFSLVSSHVISSGSFWAMERLFAAMLV